MLALDAVYHFADKRAFFADAAALLLGAGARANDVDGEGRTCLFEAEDVGATELLAAEVGASGGPRNGVGSGQRGGEGAANVDAGRERGDLEQLVTALQHLLHCLAGSSLRSWG